MQNTPTGRIKAPLLIAQGLSDPLVLPAVQSRYVRRQCASGQSLRYVTYRNRDHLSLLARRPPPVGDLLRWTTARLAGRVHPRAA